MNYFKKISYRFPVMVAAILLGLGVIVTELQIEQLIPKAIDRQSAYYLKGIITHFFYSGLMLWLLHITDLLPYTGFTRRRNWRQLWLVFPIFGLCFLNAYSFIIGDYHFYQDRVLVMITYFWYYLMVGFFEEILCRGAMLMLVLKKWGSTRKGIYFSVIIVSIMFGCAHLINFIQGRFTLTSVVAQILYAMFFGTFFAACFLRNRTIWPVIIVHAIFDMCGFLTDLAENGTFGRIYGATFTEALTSIILVFPMFLYGLFLLRKVKPLDFQIK